MQLRAAGLVPSLDVPSTLVTTEVKHPLTTPEPTSRGIRGTWNTLRPGLRVRVRPCFSRVYFDAFIFEFVSPLARSGYVEHSHSGTHRVHTVLVFGESSFCVRYTVLCCLPRPAPLPVPYARKKSSSKRVVLQSTIYLQAAPDGSLRTRGTPARSSPKPSG